MNSATVTNKRAVVPITVTVNDITGEEDKFKLDSSGFQLCRHKPSTTLGIREYFSQEARIKTEYYSEMEVLLKDV